MSSSNPQQLFSRESGRDAFHGLLISRQDGGRFLLPLHEITWVSATALEEGGCVEIQTRQRLIRLGLNRMEACLKFMDLLFSGDINRIEEGTAPPTRVNRDNFERESVTLIVEFLDLDSGSASASPFRPSTKPAATRRPAFGFPSL